MVTNEIKSERVVLQLLGIDKKWVRSSKGDWVDKKSIKEIIQLRPNPDLMNSSKRKWWKFWK